MITKRKHIKIPLGVRRCFVGNTEIQKPINHNYSRLTFETLLEQAGFTIREWNGKIWIDLKMKNLNLLNQRKK